MIETLRVIKMEREVLHPYHQQDNLQSGNNTILKLCGWPHPFNESTHEMVVFSDYKLLKNQLIITKQ